VEFETAPLRQARRSSTTDGIGRHPRYRLRIVGKSRRWFCPWRAAPARHPEIERVAVERRIDPLILVRHDQLAGSQRIENQILELLARQVVLANVVGDIASDLVVVEVP